MSGQVDSGPRRQFCCRVIRPKPLIRDGNPLYFLPSSGPFSVSTGIYWRKATMGTHACEKQSTHVPVHSHPALGIPAQHCRLCLCSQARDWALLAPALRGQFGHAHPLQEGERFCCTARSRATPFAPRLPPGLFANTDVAAVCHTGTQALADPLPGLVLCALSHMVVISLPCITQAVV